MYSNIRNMYCSLYEMVKESDQFKNEIAKIKNPTSDDYWNLYRRIREEAKRECMLGDLRNSHKYAIECKKLDHRPTEEESSRLVEKLFNESVKLENKKGKNVIDTLRMTWFRHSPYIPTTSLIEIFSENLLKQLEKDENVEVKECVLDTLEERFFSRKKACLFSEIMEKDLASTSTSNFWAFLKYYHMHRGIPLGHKFIGYLEDIIYYRANETTTKRMQESDIMFFFRMFFHGEVELQFLRGRKYKTTDTESREAVRRIYAMLVKSNDGNKTSEVLACLVNIAETCFDNLQFCYARRKFLSSLLDVQIENAACMICYENANLFDLKCQGKFDHIYCESCLREIGKTRHDCVFCMTRFDLKKIRNVVEPKGPDKDVVCSFFQSFSNFFCSIEE